ncbi:MAG: ABC transporter permease [Planctomycetota bacterium]|jgi:ABC-type lipoprotein release transport system permease subunit
MYKVILPFRYLFKKRISYLAFWAVALCVFIVVVVMTVMTGLVTDFKQKNHQFTGDCVVGTESLVGFAYYEDFVKILEREDFIEGASAVIKSYALVSPSGSEQNTGIEIMGIDPVRHSRATGFGKTLYYRKDDVSKAFEPAYNTERSGLVAGIDLMLMRDAKGRYAYEAGPIEMAFAVSCFPLTAKGALVKADTGLVNTETFYYSDISHSGLARVDSSMVYLPFERAQLLCGMAGAVKRANAIHIKFNPNVKLAPGCEKVALLWQRFVEEKGDEKRADLLKKVTVQSWKDYRRAFIAPMEKEQTMLTVMFALVGITTVFIVFVVFYMIISHKSKDIGILKSIGVSNGNIIKLFSGFAFLVGLLGSGVGVLAGWLFLLKINQIENWLFERFGFQLWDRTIYVIGDIPNTIDLKVLVVIILSAIAACLAGAFVPSHQAATSAPVEALQVNQL